MKTQSDRLEHQARQMRAEMSVTMEELRARMTPGQVIDHLADFAREGPPAEFTRNLGREIIANPLPLTLIAIGIAWLMIGSSRSSRARSEGAAAIKVTEICAREASGNQVVLCEITSSPPIDRDHAGNAADIVIAAQVDDTGSRRPGWQGAYSAEQADEQH
jgi:hypothetical protein